METKSDLEKKEKKKAYDKEYRLQNAEKKKAYYKEYRLQNAEKIKAQEKEYRLQNADNKKAYHKAYNKEYRLKNAEKVKARLKEYRLQNTEKIKAQIKEYYAQNAEKINAYNKAYFKEYYLQNADKINAQKNEYCRQRRQKDPLYRAILNLRGRIRGYCHSIRLKKNFTTMEAIGLTAQEFKKHFEGLFQEGMTWDNYGIWHVDHIKPISLATNQQEVFELNHYTNLQPLWGKDNLKKGNKYEKTDMECPQ